MNGKRVCCLYRVSTKSQLYEGQELTIPMQERACRNFVKSMPGWEIVEEKHESVSGSKVSEKKRDAIIEMRQEISEGKYDIVLVFMKDRIGRIAAETPGVLKWMVETGGVEVWSVKEGRLQLETHEDDLMNFLYFWVAEGESKKISQRVKEIHHQIAAEGLYRGGITPYGYRLVDNGRRGKKNRVLHDLEIVEEEAAVVRKMFELCEKHAYGGRRIANQLTEMGHLNRSGKKFHYSTIQRILSNPIYIGIVRCGETRSAVNPELVIVRQDVFDKVQAVKVQNTAEYHERREIPAKVDGQNLLSGNIYCGHCGGRMFGSTRADGHYRAGCGRKPQYKRVYKCYTRTQHKGVCDGQTTYVAKTVDTEVEEILLKLFANTKALRQEEVIQREFQKALDGITQRKKRAEKLLSSKHKEQKSLDAYILDALEGKGKIDAEHLQRLLDDVKNDIATAMETTSECDVQLREQQALMKRIREEREQLLQWADVYASADIRTKRLVAAHLIEKVTIHKGYELDIKLRISKEQYEGGL